MQPVEGNLGWFDCYVSLQPGHHQFKFVIDGEWRHDETVAHVADPMGNVNNTIYVQPMFTGGAAPGPEEAAAAAAASDTEMAGSGAAAAAAGPEPGGVPLVVGDDMTFTKQQVLEFLASHTVYELIPDSGKLVVLDTKLPVRQAFHALYEQGIPTAPVWDADACAITGMISASDFIEIMNRLQQSPRADMDSHTIAAWQESRRDEGKLRALIWVRPEDSLRTVMHTILQSGCALVPVMSVHNATGAQHGVGIKNPRLLHLASISSIFAYLCRQFRSSMASLPLMSVALENLPLGTFDPRFGNGGEQGKGGGVLHFVRPSTLLSAALGVLLDSGISALPVIDEADRLVDIYARFDIVKLARDEAYTQIAWDQITLKEALGYVHSKGGAGGGGGGGGGGDRGPSRLLSARVYFCTKKDSLRSIVETLALPGVRRVVVIEPETKQLQGIVTLQDVARFLTL